MKSSFLLFSILGALVSTQVFGQTKKVTTLPVSTDTIVAEKSSFDQFYERLSIGYFGVISSPTLEKWDSNNGATSPEFSPKDDPCRNCDTYSMNLWSQVNFAYNFGAKMKFNIIPRWTTFLDHPNDQGEGQRGTVLVEDLLVGFSGVVYSSPDKKFNWWMRPGVRLPTSKGSRNFSNADFGTLNYGLEWLQTFTYDFTPSFQVGLSLQERIWVFDHRINPSRLRHLTSPYVSFTLNETTKIQAYYEHFLENNKRWESINGKKPLYYDVWQNAYIGVAKDITPKLNVFPFISAFVNDVPFSTDSFWLGAWISYSFK